MVSVGLRPVSVSSLILYRFYLCFSVSVSVSRSVSVSDFVPAVLTD